MYFSDFTAVFSCSHINDGSHQPSMVDCSYLFSGLWNILIFHISSSFGGNFGVKCRWERLELYVRTHTTVHLCSAFSYTFFKFNFGLFWELGINRNLQIFYFPKISLLVTISFHQRKIERRKETSWENFLRRKQNLTKNTKFILLEVIGQIVKIINF